MQTLTRGYTVYSSVNDDHWDISTNSKYLNTINFVQSVSHIGSGEKELITLQWRAYQVNSINLGWQQKQVSLWYSGSPLSDGWRVLKFLQLTIIRISVWH